MAGRDQVLGSVRVGDEHGVFRLRRTAQALAAAAGLSERGGVRFATALSELGRDLLGAGDVKADFALASADGDRNELVAAFSWRGDAQPSRESWDAVSRLLPGSHLDEPDAEADSGRAHRAVLSVRIPLQPADAVLPQLREALAELGPATVLDDLRAQTRDLITALEDSREQRRQLTEVNAELEETNRGVMALYAELSAELEETNRGVVALYSQEHQLALTLQQSFLPQSVPSPSGVRLAVRYQPAAQDTRIGGDFYEAVETPLGLLLAVGDVAGHDLAAAMVMGELRHALRAYATEDLRPHQLLDRLEVYLHRHQPHWTATVCVALVRPDRRSVEIANAGHLPPLLLPALRSGRMLREHGPLLGIGLPQPPGTVHRLEEGDRLLMVTDGLIEVRGQDLYARLNVLLAAAEQAPGDPGALCDTLLDAFARQPSDDIAALAALITPVS